MKANLARQLTVVLFLVVSLVFGPLAGVAPAAAEPQDWDINGGHLFTQTGKGQMSGFTVTDDNAVAFWSEFQRLGGVNGVGYPVSRRFLWNGFVCQAMQKVVFQWRPDSKSVSFANVFDLAHDAGKDAWLKSAQQTPEPKQWQENGLPWEKIVEGRLAVMNNFLAIKQAYLGVGGDPVTMNGLPTTDVVDMGNNYVLRAQRVVIQQWKEDVPWAKKGEVTFGLGGAIALEAGLLPAPTAGDPEIVYTNKDKKFQASYPYNWHLDEEMMETWTFAVEANAPDANYLPGLGLQIIPGNRSLTAEGVVAIFNTEAHEQASLKDTKFSNVDYGKAMVLTLGERRVGKHVLAANNERGARIRVIRYVFFMGNTEYVFAADCADASFPKYDTMYDSIVGSFQPLP